MNKKRNRLVCLLILFIFLLQGCRATVGQTAPAASFIYLVNLDNELTNLCNGDLNQTAFFQELEKRTNIHIHWSPSIKNLQSLYQFKRSNNSAPDLIDRQQLSALYGSSLEKCLADGIILDLTELVKEYAPNYYRLIQKPEYKKIAYTPSGKIAAIYSLKQEKQTAYAGLQIRKDWLDELHLEIPVTYDDWETVLTAFKEKKGATAPLYLPALGYSLNDDLNAGFHVSSHFFHMQDQVYYGPAENGWLSYLQKMNRWYQKGLIDPNFMTGETVFADREAIRVGATGAWYGLYTLPSTIDFNENNSNANIVAAEPPRQSPGDALHLCSSDSYTDNFLAITSECENPELALQWIDYLFSEEGALLANYGIEGETYTRNEKNEPEFTDLILDNPDGLSFTQALKFYTFTPGFASAYVDWKREQQALPAEDIAMCETWSGNDSDYTLPSSLPFTLEEQERLSPIVNALSSCIYRYTNAFITGITPFSEYDAYLAELDACGLQTALQIYQDAYNRYVNAN